MPVSEESVLKPKDPSIENWDDWPTYSLKNIKVLEQLTALPVSLFTAHKSHPVKVIGHLETIDDDQSHLSNICSSRSMSVAHSRCHSPRPQIQIKDHWAHGHNHLRFRWVWGWFSWILGCRKGRLVWDQRSCCPFSAHLRQDERGCFYVLLIGGQIKEISQKLTESHRQIRRSVCH